MISHRSGSAPDIADIELFRHFKADMRRKRRDLRVGLHFEHHRTAGGSERLIPSCAHLVSGVAEDAFESEQLRIFRIGHIGNGLRAGKLGIAGQHALFPCDLV